MDFIDVSLNILIVMILVLLNGFFVAAEFAMVKVRNTRLETLAVEGNRGAKRAQRVTRNLDTYLSVCQLGITLASLGLGWVGEPAVARMLEPFLVDLGLSAGVIHSISFAFGFAIITMLHIILGELAPKSLAILKSDSVTIWAAPPLILFHKLMYPFIYVLNGSANWLLKLAGLEPIREREAAHTEDEIRILMEQSHKQGLIDNTELTLLDNIFEFNERNAREIMIPRTDMICLFTNRSFEENLEIALSERVTRYPVCENDKDNIIGFVHIKDLFQAVTGGKKQDIRDIVREVLFVSESVSLSDLLKLLQKERAQFAVVIDEYGGTAGMVTIEDILEEIVGEIQDEFDEERPTVEEENENQFSVDSKMLILEINDYFGLDLDSDDFDTLGGWLYSKIEVPPSVGQQVKYNGYAFIVTEVEHWRITRISIRKLDDLEETSSVG